MKYRNKQRPHVKYRNKQRPHVKYRNKQRPQGASTGVGVLVMIVVVIIIAALCMGCRDPDIRPPGQAWRKNQAMETR